MGIAEIFQGITAGIVYGPRPPSDPAVSSYFGGTDQSLAGTPINEWSALNLSALWRGVRILSETIGSLPMRLYRHLPGGGKEKAKDHPCYRLVHKRPNPEMTAMTFRETGQAHLPVWGNCYAEIERTNANKPLALWTITPNRVLPDRDGDDVRGYGDLYYRVTAGGGVQRIVPAADMIHIPGLGFDGLVGYSAVRMAQESLGLTMATERFGAGFFGNNAKPGGVLTHPGKLKQQAVDNLRASWERMHQGPYKAGRVAILQEGVSWTSIGVPPEDAQFLQTRKFQTIEIARWLGIPPHLLYDLERATFSNVESQGIEFVTYTLRAWAVRWEQEMDRKLLTEEEQKEYFFKIDFNELQRGDRQSRYAAYAVGRQWGWLSVNDVREEEDQNPIEGDDGDIYLIPGNMTTPEKMLAGPEPVPGETAPGEEGPTAAPEGAELLDVPDVRQQRPYDCGPAATMSACRFFDAGPEDEAEYVAELGTTTERGTTPGSMLAMLTRLKLVATAAHNMEVEDLADFFGGGSPVLCPLQTGTPSENNAERAGHWVVIIGVGLGQVFMQDPVKGRVMMTEEEFTAAWHDVDADGNEFNRYGIAVADELPDEEEEVEPGAAAAEEANAGTQVAAPSQNGRTPTPKDTGSEAPKGEALTPDPQAVQRARERHAALVAAQRQVVYDAVARLTRKECLAARRASKDPPKFLAWMDEFLPSHEKMTADVMETPCRVHLVMCGQDQGGAREESASLSSRLASESKGLYLAASEVPAAGLAASVGPVCDRLEIERPRSVADEFFRPGGDGV